MERLIKSSLISVLISTIIALILLSFLFYTIPTEAWRGDHVSTGHGGLLDADFPSRLSGTTGWTRSIFIIHTVGDIVTWIAYFIICRSLYIHNPIVKNISTSHLTMLIIALVFLICGSVPLLNAYSNIYPVYRIVGWCKVFAGIVGLSGSLIITGSLLHAKRIWEEQNLELKSIQRNLNVETD